MSPPKLFPPRTSLNYENWTLLTSISLRMPLLPKERRSRFPFCATALNWWKNARARTRKRLLKTCFAKCSDRSSPWTRSSSFTATTFASSKSATNTNTKTNWEWAIRSCSRQSARFRAETYFITEKESQIRASLNSLGDLGKVAQQSKAT